MSGRAIGRFRDLMIAIGREIFSHRRFGLIRLDFLLARNFLTQLEGGRDATRIDTAPTPYPLQAYVVWW